MNKKTSLPPDGMCAPNAPELISECFPSTRRYRPGILRRSITLAVVGLLYLLGVPEVGECLGDEPPVIATNSGLTVLEGGSETITNAHLRADDPDTGASDLVYTVTALPGHGEVSDAVFTQADIDSGLLSYQHDGSETTNDSFVFEVSDDSTTLPAAVFTITVVPVNDPPSVTNNGLTVSEGGSETITNAHLRADDPDTATSVLTYIVTTLPSLGVLSDAVFTQEDIDGGLLSYQHGGAGTINDFFVFEVSDELTTLPPMAFVIAVDSIPIFTDGFEDGTTDAW